jgi:glycosyltransferase involved in cell wall biosynthesis
MPTIAYLTNQFPSPVEPYVVAEIRELRRRGVEVISCSARRVDSSKLDTTQRPIAAETLYLQPLRFKLLLKAAYLCVCKFALLADLYERVLVLGRESPLRRAKALLHTWLGVYYALLLEGRGVEHIHVHHGYFGSWIAMVAARVLGVRFSMTLHGSDLLLHGAYLDTKLENCRFCLTVSEHNRWHILAHYPGAPPDKVLVQRMGVDPAQARLSNANGERTSDFMVMLSVGRLHQVKDHAFLVRACRRLKDHGASFLCLLAGEGPERASLEHLIEQLDLQREVQLLGQVSHVHLVFYYRMADVVVLTSRSEGIPLTLMEAMAQERIVLAPAITGIPELVEHGRTGFLYRPGSLRDFVAQVETVWARRFTLQPLQRAARQHVLLHYNRDKNLAAFGDIFLARIQSDIGSKAYAHSLLQ